MDSTHEHCHVTSRPWHGEGALRYTPRRPSCQTRSTRAPIGLAAASLTFGVDSRDGFGDDRRHATIG